MKQRGYAAGKFGLDLEGMPAGWLYSWEGGLAQGEVVQEKVGPEHLIHKHISAIKYDDITMTCGPSMSRRFYKWVDESMTQGSREYERKDGALVQSDFDFNETARLNFFNALVTEVGFPALDAASKDAAKLTVKIAPEYTKIQRKTGGKIVGGPMSQIDGKLGKRWLVRNFKIQIDGLDKATSRISKVEAITIKQKVTEYPMGEYRGPWKEPAIVEYPNVVLTLPESHSEPFFEWYEKFVVLGKCDPDNEKNGHIFFLHEDLDDKNRVCDIDLYSLGIFKITPDKAEAGAERIRMVKVEMYCERMKLGIRAAVG